MRRTNSPTKFDRRSNTKGSAGKQPAAGAKKEPSLKEPKGQKGSKYKMDFIKKDNFDTMSAKFNIT